MTRFAIFILALGAALAALVVYAYAPGLHGPFLFDDFANLPNLGATGPVESWATFWRYITSGSADPTGRPLALLSFLLDARDWPADPLPFKRTNLVLHLLNGAVLAWLLRSLGMAMRTRNQAHPRHDARITLAALLGATLWMLHPLFVSTTLYVVQREAMLSTFFMLLGLVLWVHARALFVQGKSHAGLLWLVAGLVGCTTLALLSKANGMLLPALALTIEWTFFRPLVAQPGSLSPAYKQWMLFFAAIPTLFVATYLGWEGWRGMVHGISAVRPWTLGQRLLTEPRILFDYLGLLWAPRPYTSGVFNDQVQASSGLFTPISTCFALLGVLSMAIGAWIIRKRHPAVAAAVWFFLVGHALESSTVALELYFEHRNYLPAALMFWPLALWLAQAPSPIRLKAVIGTGMPLVGTKIRLAIALALLVTLATMTHAAADLWGDSRDQALLWAKLNPDSPRAQANAALAEMAAGRPDLAIRRLKPALVNAPSQVQLALNLVGAECRTGQVEPSSLHAAEWALAHTRDPGTLLASWFERAIGQLAQPPCPQLNINMLDRLLDAALSNPYLNAQAGRLQDIYSLKGSIALVRQDGDGALLAFNRALDQQVRASAAFQQAAELGSAGFPQQALAHLEHYQAIRGKEHRAEPGMPAIHQWVLERQHYWDRELIRLQATLREDAARRAPTHS